MNIKGFIYPPTREKLIKRIRNAIKHGYRIIIVTIRLENPEGDYLKDVSILRDYIEGSGIKYIIHTEYENHLVPWSNRNTSTMYIKRILNFISSVGIPPVAIILHPGPCIKGLIEAIKDLSEGLHGIKTNAIISIENRPRQCIKNYSTMRRILKLTNVVLDLDLYQLFTAVKRDMYRFLLECKLIASELGDRVMSIHVHWHHCPPNHPNNKLPWKKIFEILNEYDLDLWIVPEVTSGARGVNSARRYIEGILQELGILNLSWQ